MMKNLLSRLTYSLTLWVAVIAATFMLFHLIPTDPARTLLGPNASEEQVAGVRQRLGLDKSLPQQFLHFVGHAASIDFGISFVDSRPVGPEVLHKMAITTILAALALVFVAVYLVIIAILQWSGMWVQLGEACDFLLVSMPTLFSAAIVALVAVVYYPFTRFSGFLNSLTDFLFLLPPAFVLALYPMGILGRILRSQMRQNTDAEYVLAARSLGLASGTIFHYVLRNSLVPLLAAFGNQLPLLLTSTFIVEIVFSVPGIGTLLLKSVLERDLPMLEGIVVVTSLLTLSITLALETIYPLIDPRIQKDRVR